MKHKYKVSIVGVDFTLAKPEMAEILTERAFKLATKIIKQGGILEFRYNCVKPELYEAVSRS